MQLAGAQAPVIRTEIAYAGFWRRVLAHLIDTTLLGSIGGGLVALVLLVNPIDYAALIRALLNAVLVYAALAWAYYSVLESSPARGTVGKIALDLFVGDVHGDPISFWRATARYWLKNLSSLFLMLGWLMAAFTPRKQALHDLLAGTLVLRRVTFIVVGQE